MKRLVLAALGLFAFAGQSQASIYSPSSVEVNFSFTAEFTTAQAGDVTDLIEQHDQHLFGYFQSPELVAQFGINQRTEGLAAPRLPLQVKVLKDEREGEVRRIRYQVSGLLLLHRQVAAKILPKGKWEIALPADLDGFYAEECTDEHYTSEQEFWYFYDPFRKGCEQFRQSPLANSVVLKVSESKNESADRSAGFQELRGDNGNGSLFQITTINGFSEDAKDRKDEGRQSFEGINEWLRAQGFEETVIAAYKNRPILQFEKTGKGPNGKEIVVRITRLLAETQIDAKNVTFAKFFRDAVKNSDVIIYSGHSGLGGNLDLDSMAAKAGPIEFDPKKKQLFFFDGCSTYSYFLSAFGESKGSHKIDVLTNGLQSYFQYEAATHKKLYAWLIDVDSNPTWGEVLTDMEKPLRGMSYLLNVGPF